MKFWSILFCIFLVSCSQELPTPMLSGIVTDVHGYKYRLVQSEKQLPDGTAMVELWERIDPLETNRWYTPSLGSKVDTNHPPIFNSLMR